MSVKDAEKYEGKNIFYSISDKNIFKNKKISIFGGGDSALDWALELSKIAKVTLIHRREEFRGTPHTLNQIKKEGKVDLIYSANTISHIEDLDDVFKSKTIFTAFYSG